MGKPRWNEMQKKSGLEEAIRNMYRQQAAEIDTPDIMWEKIQEHLNMRQNGKGSKINRKHVVLLVAVLVLVFGSITGYATIRKSETRGYATVESFSTKFSDFAGVAVESGYPGVKAVETFSNGFTYLGVWKSLNQDYDGEGQTYGEPYTILNLRYRGEGKVANISIYPGKELNLNPNRIIEVIDMNGITVYQTLYVHFSLPPDWEYKITEEQQRLLDEGIAGGGVSSDNTEITRYDIIGFQWQQGDYNYSVSHDYYFRNMTSDDLEVLAREMVEINQ